MRFTSASAALGRKIRGCFSTSSISKRQTDHLRHPWQSPHLYGDSFSPAILYGMEYRIAGLIWDMEKKPTDSQCRGRVLPAQRRPCRIKFFPLLSWRVMKRVALSLSLEKLDYAVFDFLSIRLSSSFLIGGGTGPRSFSSVLNVLQRRNKGRSSLASTDGEIIMIPPSVGSICRHFAALK